MTCCDNFSFNVLRLFFSWVGWFSTLCVKMVADSLSIITFEVDSLSSAHILEDHAFICQLGCEDFPEFFCVPCLIFRTPNAIILVQCHLSFEFFARPLSRNLLLMVILRSWIWWATVIRCCSKSAYMRWNPTASCRWEHESSALVICWISLICWIPN